MEPLGLTAAQADVLFVIGRAGPLSLKELGGLVIAEAGHPSRLVDRLVEAGFVARETRGDDRRAVELALTPKGRKLEREVQRVRDELFSLAQAATGGRDLEPVLAVLRDFVGKTSYAELFERRRELS